MKPKSDIRNGIIVFDEPLCFGEGNVVYGILYNNEIEKQNEETHPISDYVSYLAGIEKIIKNGVPLEDGEGWEFPKENVTVTGNLDSLARFVSIFFKGNVGFKTYTFNDPIVWGKDEVDEDDNNLIINTSLISRYLDIK